MFAPTVTRVIHVVAENEALEKTLETRLERMRHDGVEKEIKTFIETYPTAAKSNNRRGASHWRSRVSGRNR